MRVSSGDLAQRRWISLGFHQQNRRKMQYIARPHLGTGLHGGVPSSGQTGVWSYQRLRSYQSLPNVPSCQWKPQKCSNTVSRMADARFRLRTFRCKDGHRFDAVHKFFPHANIATCLNSFLWESDSQWAPHDSRKKQRVRKEGGKMREITSGEECFPARPSRVENSTGMWGSCK